MIKLTRNIFRFIPFVLATAALSRVIHVSLTSSDSYASRAFIGLGICLASIFFEGHLLLANQGKKGKAGWAMLIFYAVYTAAFIGMISRLKFWG